MSHLNDTAEQWDLEIKPKASLLDLNLKEVWRYRDLMMLFVRRDFVAQYKQTILGPIWHIIQPVLTTIMFLLVFGKIANIPTDGIEPILFYMSGITIWNYFSTCLTATSNTFVANAHIFGKVYFPRLVLPLSIVMSNIIKLGIQFGILFLGMIWFALFRDIPIYFGMNWLLIPVLVIIMAGIGLGLGIIISSLTTKYRDFTVLIGFAVQLLMYATPVAYPLSFLKDKSFAPIIEWNPLSPIVEGFRYALFHTGNFNFMSLGYSVIFMFVVLVIGAVYFSKVERTFMDTV
ncbi:ABC transporter permease [Lacibacter sediminis]|uniref:Transport permease protein n=1 Tax=Lacibacter sediminis TaxID=2760713 RepID=A0A7G5XHM5_9BACT|nr:ABC transporter permease [Lacibacter sediminis]QNA44978.1 ABC transporter permease [Lacibacter sediminis]